MGPKNLGGKTVPVPPFTKVPIKGDIGEPVFPFRVPVVPEGNNSPTAPGRTAQILKNIPQSFPDLLKD